LQAACWSTLPPYKDLQQLHLLLTSAQLPSQERAVSGQVLQLLLLGCHLIQWEGLLACVLVVMLSLRPAAAGLILQLGPVGCLWHFLLSLQSWLLLQQMPLLREALMPIAADLSLSCPYLLCLVLLL